MKIKVDLSQNSKRIADWQDGWQVEEQAGTFELDLDQIQLWKPTVALENFPVCGFRSKRMLEEQKIKGLPSEVMFYLLRNQNLIPSEWREFGHIIFPGTEYDDPDLCPVIMAMTWYEEDDRWRYERRYVASYMFSHHRVAFL